MFLGVARRLELSPCNIVVTGSPADVVLGLSFRGKFDASSPIGVSYLDEVSTFLP